MPKPAAAPEVSGDMALIEYSTLWKLFGISRPAESTCERFGGSSWKACTNYCGITAGFEADGKNQAAAMWIADPAGTEEKSDEKAL
jgi:hypothetical protein